MKIKEIFLFDNGNTAVFDENGKQIPKLQENIFVQIFKKAKRIKIEIDENVKIKTPNYEDWKKLKGYDNITK